MNATILSLCIDDIFNKSAPNWYHYIIYYLVAALGLVLNISLLVIYKLETKSVLGNRATFVVSMTMQTITDSCISVFIISDQTVLLYYSYVGNEVKQIFSGVRNAFVLSQSVMYNILAFDRFFAAFSPTSIHWHSDTAIRIYLMSIGTVIVPLETLYRVLILVKYLDCSELLIVRRVFTLWHALMWMALIVINMTFYATLAVYFRYHMRIGASNDMKNRMKVVVKLATVSFETSVVFTLSLCPAMVASFISGDVVSITLIELEYVNSVTNSLIFILNNKFILRKLQSMKSTINIATSVTQRNIHNTL